MSTRTTLDMLWVMGVVSRIFQFSDEEADVLLANDVDRCMRVKSHVWMV